MIIVGSKLEDNLNFLANGRHPQYFGKWKTTSIFWKIEDDLIFWGKWKTTKYFWKMEDDLNLKEIGRQPQFKRKCKTTLILK